MQDTLSAKLAATWQKKAKAGEVPKPVEIRDRDLKGFLLRVQPSGRASYIVQLGRGKRLTIGDAAILTPAQARTKAKVALGAAADGRDPKAALKVEDGSTVPTLDAFLADTYGPWMAANRKTGATTVARMRAVFPELLDSSLDNITAWQMEKSRKAQLQAGRAVATVNRNLAVLKAALNKAVEWELIDRNPLVKVKPGRVDNAGIVRFLSADEEGRLRKALADRDARVCAGRESANAWRAARARDTMPALGTYADHLTPMVLVSINTGVRRGELFNLAWQDVDLARGNLTVRGSGAKSGRTRHVPLNDEAARVLRTWHRQAGEPDAGLVFPGKAGARLDTIKTAWSGLLKAAGISAFRWHDLRHTFASKLVMAGVDLNTVRELLGHGDLTMTLRYAHLAPAHKAAAVSRLVEG